VTSAGHLAEASRTNLLGEDDILGPDDALAPEG
jgi:hypothetical protein